MPEEQESPVEALADKAHEVASEARETWLRLSAVLSACLAVIAATASLEAGRYANDALLEQISASDQWSYYQAKGIKANVASSEAEILAAMGKPDDAARKAAEKYKSEQDGISKEATKLTVDSKHHLDMHEVLSRAVTVCQVAIAVVAIAVLTRSRGFVWLAAAFGLAGLAFLVEGLVFV